MKLFCLLLLIIIAGCTKVEISPRSSGDLSLSQADHALAPMQCRTLTLSSLSMKKELYSDARTKSLFISTEVFLGYNRQWHLKFVYSKNQAKIIGGRADYYLGRKINSNRDTIEVNFNSYGHATSVYTINTNKMRARQLLLSYNTSNPSLVTISRFNNTPVVNDSKGNIVSIKKDAYNGVTYKYNLNSGTGKRHFYQPAIYPVTQEFLLGDYFALLELMQWVPPSRSTRTSVTLWPSESGEINQTTYYYNHKFDASGRLLSYNFGYAPGEPYARIDNIGWYCR